MSEAPASARGVAVVPVRTPASPTPYGAPAPQGLPGRHAVPPAEAPVRRRGLSGLLRRAVEGTPGRLRLLAAGTAMAATLFGAVTATTLWSSSSALGRADHNTTQVVRVQSIYSDLLHADADATNTFLVGGLEDAGKRADYDATIATVAQTIAEAAEAQPADGEALGALNQEVQQYTALVEQARAYNRQGLPVGAAYLTLASAGLRSGAQPIVASLTTANVQRQQQEITNSSDQNWLDGVSLLAGVVLVLSLVWVARRSHRYLNPGLTAALVLVVVSLAAALSVLSSVETSTRAAADGPAAIALDLATIRTAAFDAKADESLTLIARGNGAAYEQGWKAASADVTTTLAAMKQSAGNGTLAAAATDLTTQWQAYSTKHVAIRTADDGSDYDGALKLAGQTGAGSANAAFSTFSDSAAAALTRAQTDAGAALSAPRTSTTVWGWVLLLASLAAAGLALRGVARRLEEYR